MDNDVKVVAVRRDAEGSITNFRLSDGREVTKSECASMVDAGELHNLVVQKGRSGATIIRSQVNTPQANLSELPTF